MTAAQAQATNGFRVDRIATLEALEQIATDWDRVQDATASKHVLLDHRWMCAWWRAFGAGKQLHVLVLRRGERVVGIAPMILSRGYEAFPRRDTQYHLAEDAAYLRGPNWRAFVPIRKVSFPVNVASHNARAHFLFPEAGPEAFDAVFAYWWERRGEWDLMVCEGLPLDSEQPGQVAAAVVRQGGRVLPKGREVELQCAHLPETMEGYLRTHSSDYRRRYRKALAANARKGAIGTDEYRGARLEEGMALLFALEQRSWKVEGRAGQELHLPLDDRLRGFLGDVAEGFGRRDQAHVTSMTCDGKPVAALLGLERQGVLLLLVTYMDSRFRGELTTTSMFNAIIEGAIARGLGQIDFNGSSLNVRKMANASHVHVRRSICHGGLYSRLLGASKSASMRVSQALRAARDKLPTGSGGAGS